MILLNVISICFMHQVCYGTLQRCWLLAAELRKKSGPWDLALMRPNNDQGGDVYCKLAKHIVKCGCENSTNVTAFIDIHWYEFVAAGRMCIASSLGFLGCTPDLAQVPLRKLRRSKHQAWAFGQWCSIGCEVSTRLDYFKGKGLNFAIKQARLEMFPGLFRLYFEVLW